MEKNLIEWDYDVIGIVDNAIDAKEILAKKNPAIILMDINLKGQENGLDIAEKISDRNIPIIFITGQNDAATYESVKHLKGVSFLVKPFDILTLKALLELHPALQKTQKDHIFLKKNKKITKVFIKDIQFIKSDKNYCDIYTLDNYFTIKTSLRKVIKDFPLDLFIKVHKSYIINFSSIESIIPAANQIKLKTETIPIGRNFKKSFLKRFEKYQRENH